MCSSRKTDTSTRTLKAAYCSLVRVHFHKFIQNTVSSAFSVKSRMYQVKMVRGEERWVWQIYDPVCEHTHTNTHTKNLLRSQPASPQQKYKTTLGLFLLFISVSTRPPGNHPPFQLASLSLVPDLATHTLLLFFVININDKNNTSYGSLVYFLNTLNISHTVYYHVGPFYCHSVKSALCSVQTCVSMIIIPSVWLHLTR